VLRARSVSASPTPLSPPGSLAARVSSLVRAPWALPALLLLVLAAHSLARKDGEDFQVFHLAGERALAGQPLYFAHDIALPFKYAPVAALVFSALALAPLAAARALFALLTVVALVRLLCW
jgi:hypothetical protein